MILAQENEMKNTALINAMDSINEKYGIYTISPAQLLEKTNMNDVIAPAWKPNGWRKSV